MSRARDQHDDLELRRLARVKQTAPQTIPPLGPELIGFFKNSVQKRHTKLSKIAACWERLVPPTLAEHCSLESFQRGSLAVLVDSSPHLYDLKQLLLAGLQKQLLIACKAEGLKKITLKPGRWYDGDSPNERKLRFD